MKYTYVRRKIKEDAKRLLDGNWLKSFLILIIEMLAISFFLSFIASKLPKETIMAAGENITPELLGEWIVSLGGLSLKTLVSFGVISILCFFVFSPFSVGISRFFLGVAKGTKPRVRDIFSVYANISLVFSSIWLDVLLNFVMIFWGVIFMAVPTVILALGMYFGSEGIFFLGIFLVLAASVFVSLWNSRYIFARYIFAEGGKGAFESIVECTELMSGRTKECIVLRLSYVVWDVVSGYMPVLRFPYFALSSTVYAKYLFYLREDPAFFDDGTSRVL